MGREVKRVAMDFDWPIGMIWKGYWHPFHALPCKACDRSGLNPEMKKLSDSWYGFDNPEEKWCHNITQDEVQALVDASRLKGFTHVPRTEEQRKIVEEKIANGGNSWLPESNGYVPTAEEVNAWSAGPGFGHDSINKMICVEQRAKRLGIDTAYCKYCGGEGGIYPNEEIAAMSEKWENFHPPSGDGYQLWETTSEGSPTSPVFATPEELARWLTDNNASTFGHETTSYENWLAFIRGPGWAPSMVGQAGKLESGVDAAAANFR